MRKTLSLVVGLLLAVLLTYSNSVFALCVAPKKINEHRAYINSKLMEGTVVLDVEEKIEISGCYIATLDVYPEDVKLNSISTTSAGVTERGVAIGERLEAKATSGDLRIEEHSPARQILNPDGATSWEWHLYPSKEGLLGVTFTLSAIIQIEGKSEALVVDTWKRTMEFNASKTDKLKNFTTSNWKWLISVILLPLALWGLRSAKNHLRKRGKNTKETNIILPGDDDFRQ